MVAESLSAKGLHAFLPKRRVKSRRRDRRRMIDVPVFPGYLFVETAMTPHDWQLIRKTPGVVSILGYGDTPAPIPRYQVESLRTVVQVAMQIDPYPYLHEGQRVRVVSGPLKGATGILVEKKEGQQRLVCTLDIMNQAVAVTLDACEVEPWV